jgi:hypothetical protein
MDTPDELPHKQPQKRTCEFHQAKLLKNNICKTKKCSR